MSDVKKRREKHRKEKEASGSAEQTKGERGHQSQRGQPL